MRFSRKWLPVEGLVGCLALGIAGGLLFQANRAASQRDIYVSDLRTDSVYVFDANFGAKVKVAKKPVAIIAGFDNPWGVAVDPVGGAFAMVANRGGDSVSRIDTATQTIAAVIPVGKQPQGIDITPDGLFALVANTGSKSVSVIETATNSVIRTVKVKKDPRSVAIDQAGAFALVNSLGSKTISIVDLAVATKSARVSTRRSPKGVRHLKKRQGVCKTPSGGLDARFEEQGGFYLAFWTCKPNPASRRLRSGIGDLFQGVAFDAGDILALFAGSEITTEDEINVEDAKKDPEELDAEDDELTREQNSPGEEHEEEYEEEQDSRERLLRSLQFAPNYISSSRSARALSHQYMLVGTGGPTSADRSILISDFSNTVRIGDGAPWNQWTGGENNGLIVMPDDCAFPCNMAKFASSSARVVVDGDHAFKDAGLVPFTAGRRFKQPLIVVEE